MGHTPGPWKVVDRFYIWTDDDVGCEVARVCDENLDDDCLPQADADASLIAAAPALLERLRECVTWLEDYYDAVSMDDDQEQHLEAARAAIAKAEGRSE